MHCTNRNSLFLGLFSGQSVFRGVCRPLKHMGLDLTWSRRFVCTTGLLIGVRRKPSDRSWLWIRIHPTAWTPCCPIHHHICSTITVAQIQVRFCCCANTPRLCLHLILISEFGWSDVYQVLFIHYHSFLYFFNISSHLLVLYFQFCFNFK